MSESVACSTDMEQRLDFRFFIELQAQGKRKVLDWCIAMGLLASSMECPKCKKSMRLVSIKEAIDGYGWRCRSGGENGHSMKRSVRKGSWFERSKMSLANILLVTYLWIKKAQVDFIAEEVRLSRKTVVDWKSFCREICVEMCVTENEELGGPDKIVQINESKFGKRKDEKGNIVNRRWVFGGVEKGSNRCFFEVVDKVNKKVLLKVIKAYILPGTTLVSSCWKTYNCLSDQEFVQLTSKDSITLKDSTGQSDINHKNGAWSCLIKFLGGNKKAPDQFYFHLCEFIWRWRHRNEPQGIFLAFLQAVKAVYDPNNLEKEET